MMKLTSGNNGAYGKFRKLFVIGPPRSGTTLLHALCCTSEDTNDYVAECSFFTGLVRNFQEGRRNLKAHNTDFFGSEAAFNAYNANLFKQVLADAWESLGRPKILALKDPQMTACMVEMLELLPEVRFLVSVRNAADTLKSRLKVMQKANLAITPQFVQTVLNEYLGFYTLAVKVAQLSPKSVTFCCYENLLQQQDKSKLAKAAGIAAIDETRLWTPARSNAAHFKNENDPWASEKYGGAIDAGKRNEDVDISPYTSVLGQLEPIYAEAKAKSVI